MKQETDYQQIVHNSEGYKAGWKRDLPEEAH